MCLEWINLISAQISITWSTLEGFWMTLCRIMICILFCFEVNCLWQLFCVFDLCWWCFVYAFFFFFLGVLLLSAVYTVSSTIFEQKDGRKWSNRGLRSVWFGFLSFKFVWLHSDWNCKNAVNGFYKSNYETEFLF